MVLSLLFFFGGNKIASCVRVLSDDGARGRVSECWMVDYKA